MKTLQMKQGSGEWLAARLGVVTASEMDALVSPEGKVRDGKGVDSYLYKKLCEKILGFASGGGGSFATDQGTLLETEARPWYEFTYDRKVDVVGFCVTDDGRLGCSPDGLVGEDGGLEIKCFQPEHSLEVFLKKAMPKENIIQVQASFFVTGRKWWDWVSYSRQWSPLVIRVEPDPKLQAAIKEATDAFFQRFDLAYAQIKGVRDQEKAEKEAHYYATDPDYLAWAAKQKQATA